MPQNQQHIISQNPLKHHNQFLSVRNEAIRWLKIKTDPGKKLKVESTVKERYQQQLCFNKIDIIKVKQNKSTDQDIFTIPINPTINSYFNKYPMLWYIIHRQLLQSTQTLQPIFKC